MKVGALVVAQLSGAPVIPVATSASSAWWVTGWDRFQIPKPFSRICICYGRPIVIPRDATESDLQRYAGIVEAELNAMMARSDAGV